jgi:glycine/D-amino acid oxidase-like deaminating enzyme
MLMRRSLPHVIVIGAGIVGAATAYYLSRAGATVTLLEADTPSAGATGASDGAVSVASKRPGTMMRLAREARDLYVRLAHDGTLAGVFFARPTYLIARHPLEVELIENQGRNLTSLGEPCLALSRAELLQRMPGLGAAVLAGLKVQHDGHAIGYQVVHRLLACAHVVPRRHTAVRQLLVVGGRVLGVETSQGTITADSVVVAAGLGSAALLGLDDVLIPRQGQLIITDRATASGPALPGPLMSASYLAAKRTTAPDQCSVSLVIDPLQTGQFLIGSSREAGRSDRATDVRTVAAMLREALAAYPPLARQRVIRTFAGVRATTRDGLPIVGRHPTLDGLVIATGMQGDGICLGPLLGAAAAQLACDVEPCVDIAALSPQRFASMEIGA